MAGKKRSRSSEPLEFRNTQLADALQTQDMAALAFALRHGPTVVPLLRPGQRDATIFLVRGNRLEPVRRVLQRSDGAELLRALFGGPADEERRLGIRSAIPTGVTPVQVTRTGSVAVVEAPEQITRSEGEDQVLAVAQIVYTLTASDGVRSVQLTRSGAPTAAPSGDGRLVTRPLTRADFIERAPAG